MRNIFYRKWRSFHSEHLVGRKLKFISWFNKKFPAKYCWADCVAWSYSPTRFNPFKLDRSRACEIESKEHYTGLCYCGEWNEGKCFVALPKEEQEKTKEESKLQEAELPF